MMTRIDPMLGAHIQRERDEPRIRALDPAGHEPGQYRRRAPRQRQGDSALVGGGRIDTFQQVHDAVTSVQMHRDLGRDKHLAAALVLSQNIRRNRCAHLARPHDRCQMPANPLLDVIDVDDPIIRGLERLLAQSEQKCCVLAMCPKDREVGLLEVSVLHGLVR